MHPRTAAALAALAGAAATLATRHHRAADPEQPADEPPPTTRLRITTGPHHIDIRTPHPSNTPSPTDTPPRHDAPTPLDHATHTALRILAALPQHTSQPFGFSPQLDGTVLDSNHERAEPTRDPLDHDNGDWE
ncbi:hypothetical protein [Streptomyces pini]|nr:hypothetical protein [Streptomyces pini]